MRSSPSERGATLRTATFLCKARLDLNGHNLDLRPGDPGSFLHPGDHCGMELTGAVSGMGNILLHGFPGSSLEINGPDRNTFQGAVNVFGILTTESPVNLWLRKGTGPALPGPLTLRDNAVLTLYRSEQIPDDATVELRDGVTINLNGLTESIGTLTVSNVQTQPPRPTTVNSSSPSTTPAAPAMTSCSPASPLRPCPCLRFRRARHPPSACSGRPTPWASRSNPTPT